MRRPGDALLRTPPINNSLRQHYQCDHVKEGARVEMQLDTPYGLVAVCSECSQFGDLELQMTDGGKVMFRQVRK